LSYPACGRVCKGLPDLYHYHAFGLRIASELELPELHRGDPPPDIEIRYRPSEQPPLMTGDFWLEVSPGRASNRLEDIQFTVEDGRSILIETFPSTPSYDIRVWLLGTVMATLLYQRGYLPIHANLLALDDGRAAAFAGDSGSGKSTLAAWFESRGHPVLSDDLCAILPSDDGTPQAFEGIPRLKLWRETLEAFGLSPTGLEKVASDLDKFHVRSARVNARGSIEPLHLERIYLLGRASADAPFRIVPLSGAEAATGIIANAFRWEYGQRIQPEGAQFANCLALARSARVFRVERRWGFDHFEEDSVEIERHLMTPLEELRGA
jgi:hypothetical protein